MKELQHKETTAPMGVGVGFGNRGFSLLELLVVLAIVASISALGILIMNRMEEGSKLAKLHQDVETINRAIQLYKSSGGAIPADATPQAVLAKLKTRADRSQASRIVGHRGSVIDHRLTVVMQTEAEADVNKPRALWNSAKQRFEVASLGAVGVKEFRIGESATAAAEEVRDTAVKYAAESDWIWDYDESTDSARREFFDVPVSTASQATPPTASYKAAAKLLPPEFSIESSTHPLREFDLELFLTNPNSSKNSILVYRIGSGPLDLFLGESIIVQPGASVEAFVATIDPDQFDDSDTVTESYIAVPVIPVSTLSVSKLSYTYFEAGGAWADGNGGSVATPPSPAIARILNLSEIPLIYQNDSVFNGVWTYDGTDPKSSTTRKLGAPFQGGFVNQTVDLSLANWNLASGELRLNYMVEGIRPALVTDSEVQSISLTSRVVDLPAPAVEKISEETKLLYPGAEVPESSTPETYQEAVVAIMPDFQLRDIPTGARIYYTIDGSDPGVDASGNPVAGILYTGTFALNDRMSAAVPDSSAVFAGTTDGWFGGARGTADLDYDYARKGRLFGHGTPASGYMISSPGLPGVSPGTEDQPGTPSTLTTVTVALKAVKDNWLRLREPLRNYGVDNELELNPKSDDTKRIIVEFDLSSIPADAVIEAAELSLQRLSGGKKGEIFEVRALTEQWEEGTLKDKPGTSNWNYSSDSAMWSAPGGTTDGNVYAMQAAPSQNVPMLWNVRTLVQSWVSGTLANRGILIRDQSEGGGDPFKFSSREGSFPPTLTITYTTGKPGTPGIPGTPATSNSIAASPVDVGDGGAFTVTMTLVSDDPLAGVTPGALSVVGSAGVGATFSAPVPATQNIPAGVPVTFTWNGRATAGASSGALFVSGTATSSSGYTFAMAQSNNVLVAGRSAVQNILEFAGASFADVDLNEEFLLGQLSFANTTTVAGTDATGVDLYLQLSPLLPKKERITVPLEIISTPNSGLSPADDADVIRLTQRFLTAPSMDPFELQIRFRSAGGGAFATDDTFSVYEQQQGTVGIYGRLVETSSSSGIPVTARVYPPQGLGKWFNASPPVSERITFSPPDEVLPWNNLVDAVDDSGFATDEDTVLAGGGLLSNDTAPDGGLGALATTVFSRSGASVVISGTGGFTYDPSVSSVLQFLAAGETIVDTFMYTAQDADGDSDSAMVFVTVTGLDEVPVNNPVVAADDPTGFSTNQNTSLQSGNVLDNDSAPDGGLAVVAGVVTSTSGAAVTLEADGTFLYNPSGVAEFDLLQTGQSIADTFRYTATDVDGDTDQATVTVTVNYVPDSVGNPVIAVDDFYSTGEDTLLKADNSRNLLANDTGVDGGLRVVVTGSITSFHGAAVTLQANGRFTYDPKPAAALQALGQDQSLDDTFTYTVMDADGDTDQATVTVRVTGDPGLSEGHFDVDTSSTIASIGSGKTDGHVHSYDDKYQTTGVNYFNIEGNKLSEIFLDIPDPATKFKIIVVNADLSIGAKLVINKAYVANDPSTYIMATNYDDSRSSNLPVYSLGGVAGTTKLTQLGVYFDPDAIALGGLLPSVTGAVRSNVPGKNGEWRNGAFTIQAVLVKPDGSDGFTADRTLSAGGSIGAATSGLLWESTIFWHRSGPSYDNQENTFVPGSPQFP